MATTRGRQVVVPIANKSGGGVVAGDVVVIDTANDAAFTTTTTGRAEVSIGVAQETIANNATGRVLVAGYAALVNVPSSVTRGHYAETHTAVKQATGNSARRSGSFGQFLTGGTTPTAILWGQTDQSTTGSGLTIREVDGSPTGTPSTLKFPNGTLTDNGDGSFTFTEAAGATPGMVLIEEHVTSGSSESSITFSSIPGTYRHLWIVWSSRGTNAAAQTFGARFNGDTASNYDAQSTTSFNNTSFSTGSSTAQTSARAGSIPPSGAPSGACGTGDIKISDYAGTTFHKSFVQTHGRKDATSSTGLVAEHGWGTWRSTSAITSITLLPAAGNFDVGSVFSLYGLD